VVFVTKNNLLLMGLCPSILFAMIEIPITLALCYAQESFFWLFLNILTQYLYTLNNFRAFVWSSKKRRLRTQYINIATIIFWEKSQQIRNVSDSIINFYNSLLSTPAGFSGLAILYLIWKIKNLSIRDHFKSYMGKPTKQ